MTLHNIAIIIVYFVFILTFSLNEIVSSRERVRKIETDTSDYQHVKHKVAVVTIMFSPAVHLGALLLGKSFDHHHSHLAGHYERVLLHTPGALTNVYLDELREGGWNTEEIPLVHMKNVGAKHERFAKSFTKLQLWNLTRFDRVIYFDTDMLITHRADALFYCTLPLCAAPNPPLAESFNAGLLVLRPDSELYTHMISDISERDAALNDHRYASALEYFPYAEQTYLNDIFPYDKFLHSSKLSNFYNMPASIFFVDPLSKMNRPHHQKIYALHYTDFKPWKWPVLPWSTYCCAWIDLRASLDNHSVFQSLPFAITCFFFALYSLVPLRSPSSTPVLFTSHPLLYLLLSIAITLLSNLLAFLLIPNDTYYMFAWLYFSLLAVFFSYIITFTLFLHPSLFPRIQLYLLSSVAFPVLYLVLFRCSSYFPSNLIIHFIVFLSFDLFVVALLFIAFDHKLK